jgi:hypothetical protein
MFLASPTSRGLCYIFSFILEFHALSFQWTTCRDPELVKRGWSLRPFFEIMVKASMNPSFLHSACLLSQHHVKNAKFYFKLQQ